MNGISGRVDSSAADMRNASFSVEARGRAIIHLHEDPDDQIKEEERDRQQVKTATTQTEHQTQHQTRLDPFTEP